MKPIDRVRAIEAEHQKVKGASAFCNNLRMKATYFHCSEAVLDFILFNEPCIQGDWVECPLNPDRKE